MDKLDKIIFESDLETMFRFLVILPGLGALIVALVIRLTELLLNKCCKKSLSGRKL